IRGRRAGRTRVRAGVAVDRSPVIAVEAVVVGRVRGDRPRGLSRAVQEAAVVSPLTVVREAVAGDRAVLTTPIHAGIPEACQSQTAPAVSVEGVTGDRRELDSALDAVEVAVGDLVVADRAAGEGA